jgi:hypothetical protein
MSQQYKDKINQLVESANNGNTEAAKQLLEEGQKWHSIINDMKNKDSSK